MADNQFIADGSVAVFRSNKQAAEYGNENTHKCSIHKKRAVQRRGVAIFFHIEILTDGDVKSQAKHKEQQNPENFAFFQAHKSCA